MIVLPDRRGCGVAVIVLAWTAIATVIWVAGAFVLDALFGGIAEAPPALVVLWWLSWPTVAVLGSVWTVRRRHRSRAARVKADHEDDVVTAGSEAVWDDTARQAILPDLEAERLAPSEIRSLVRAFDGVRRRAAGRHAAPLSWLPDSGRRVATALELALEEAEEEGDWPAIRERREAILDLQAFLPDDEAVAAEAYAGRGDDAGDDGAGRVALERVRWAQAIVISMLRDDEQYLGAHNALAETDIVIGEARRSLEAVDRYKGSQIGGFGAMLYWPVGLIGGLLLGTLLAGLSVVAVVIVVALVVAGYATPLYLAPAFGWAVGTIGSRLDRLAMRADDIRVLRVGRVIAAGVELVLFFATPVLIGLVTAIVCGWLGLTW